MAGFGPMYVASMAPALRASIAAGPALKTCVLSLVSPSSLAMQALADAYQRRAVGDVAEVAELELGGRATSSAAGAAWFVAAKQRGSHGGAGTDQEHKPDGQGDLQRCGGAWACRSHRRRCGWCRGLGDSGVFGAMTGWSPCWGCWMGPGGWSAPATSPREVRARAGKGTVPERSCIHRRECHECGSIGRKSGVTRVHGRHIRRQEHGAAVGAVTPFTAFG